MLGREHTVLLLAQIEKMVRCHTEVDRENGRAEDGFNLGYP